MVATIHARGHSPAMETWDYIFLCDNGVAFFSREKAFIGKTGTRINLPDDMCQLDSGWIPWQCEKDGLQFWSRTRPGGKVVCPMCSNEEVCPLNTKLYTEEYGNEYVGEEDEL